MLGCCSTASSDDAMLMTAVMMWLHKPSCRFLMGAVHTVGDALVVLGCTCKDIANGRWYFSIVDGLVCFLSFLYYVIILYLPPPGRSVSWSSWVAHIEWAGSGTLYMDGELLICARFWSCPAGSPDHRHPVAERCNHIILARRWALCWTDLIGRQLVGCPS